MPKPTVRPAIAPETHITLQTTVEQYLDIKAAIDRLTLEYNTLKADLTSEAFAAHKRGEVAETDTHWVKYVESESRSVSEESAREAMTAAGIAPGLIAKVLKKATRVKPYAYGRVIEKKDAKLDREERGKR